MNGLLTPAFIKHFASLISEAFIQPATRVLLRRTPSSENAGAALILKSCSNNRSVSVGWLVGFLVHIPRKRKLKTEGFMQPSQREQAGQAGDETCSLFNKFRQQKDKKLQSHIYTEGNLKHHKYCMTTRYSYVHHTLTLNEINETLWIFCAEPVGWASHWVFSFSSEWTSADCVFVRVCGGRFVGFVTHLWRRHKRWRQWSRQWLPWHPCNSSDSSQYPWHPAPLSGPASCSTACQAHRDTRWPGRPSARGPQWQAAGPDGRLAPVPAESDQARPRPECAVPWEDVRSEDMAQKFRYGSHFSTLSGVYNIHI